MRKGVILNPNASLNRLFERHLGVGVGVRDAEPGMAEWSVFGSYSFEGGAVQVRRSSKVARVYYPFNDDDALNALAAVVTDDDAVAFARSWGLLSSLRGPEPVEWICRHAGFVRLALALLEAWHQLNASGVVRKLLGTTLKEEEDSEPLSRYPWDYPVNPLGRFRRCDAELLVPYATNRAGESDEAAHQDEWNIEEWSPSNDPVIGMSKSMCVEIIRHNLSDMAQGFSYSSDTGAFHMYADGTLLTSVYWRLAQGFSTALGYQRCPCGAYFLRRRRGQQYCPSSTGGPSRCSARFRQRERQNRKGLKRDVLDC